MGTIGKGEIKGEVNDEVEEEMTIC